MNIFIDLNGNAKLLSATLVTAGSNVQNVNVYAPFDSNSSTIRVLFILPDGSQTVPFMMTYTGQANVNGAQVNGWSYTLNSNVTQLVGTCLIVIQQFSNFGRSLLNSFQVPFEIVQSALPIVSLPPDDPLAQVQAIAKFAADEVNPISMEVEAITLVEGEEATADIELSSTPSTVAGYNNWIYKFKFGLPQGPIGPQGPEGVSGTDGNTFFITGQVDTILELPDANTTPIGTAYFVGTVAPRLVYALLEYGGIPTWVNQGALAGPQGEQGPIGPQGEVGNQGDIGYGWLTTVAQINPGNNIINLGDISGTDIRVQDLIISNDSITLGRYGIIIAITDTHVTCQYLGNLKGVIGPQGQQGVPGEKGPQGVTGPQGPQGVEGTQGLQGLQGIQGELGARGPQGVQGPQGVSGEDGVNGNGLEIVGKVDFEIDLPTNAVLGTAYFVGTIIPYDVYSFVTTSLNPTGEWVNDGPIQGPQGPQGIQGSQGVQGIQGVDGTQGIQGEVGPIGSQGIQGIEGPAGPIGEQGVQGPQGVEGPQGPQGPQGEVGPQGSAGDEVPIGTFIWYYGKSSPSEKWLICDGTAVSGDYPLLQAHLQAQVGNINLPNLLDGRFIRSVTPGASELGVLQDSENKLHNHIIDGVGDHSHNIQTRFNDGPAGNQIPKGSVIGSQDTNPVTQGAGAHTHNMQFSGTNESRPINISMLPLMKAK